MILPYGAIQPIPGLDGNTANLKDHMMFFCPEIHGVQHNIRANGVTPIQNGTIS